MDGLKPRRIRFKLDRDLSWTDTGTREVVIRAHREAEHELLNRAQDWITESATAQQQEGAVWNIILRPGYFTFEGAVGTGVYTLHCELWLIEHNFMVEPPRYFPPLDRESEQFDDVQG